MSHNNTLFQGITKDYTDAMKAAEIEFKKIMAGQVDDLNWENCKPFNGYLAKNVGDQKKRIGGNFAVAHAIPNQDLRDHIRKVIPEVIFIVMSLTKENQMKRIRERHGDQAEAYEGFVTLAFNLYDKPGQGEENTYNVDITEDMTSKDVFEQVLEIIDRCSK